MLSPSSIVDLLAILPFYLEQVLAALDVKLQLEILRLLRLFQAPQPSPVQQY